MATPSRDYLTIVSGLPRSGTSMMMRMTEAGGLPVMIDEIRTADEDNPNGYYEFEPVKQTKEDASWLENSNGKVVKMVYRLLYDLPADRDYYVLFMRRALEEILASQRVMLDRHNSDGEPISDEEMGNLFRAEIDGFYAWLGKQNHIKLIDVDYNSVMSDPETEVARISEFLGGGLDIEAMVRVVDPSLYRNRRDSASSNAPA